MNRNIKIISTWNDNRKRQFLKDRGFLISEDHKTGITKLYTKNFLSENCVASFESLSIAVLNYMK